MKPEYAILIIESIFFAGVFLVIAFRDLKRRITRLEDKLLKIENEIFEIKIKNRR